MRVFVTVWEGAGQYYATLSPGRPASLGPMSTRIFDVEGKSLPEAQEKAREEARKRDIDYIINLD